MLLYCQPRYVAGLDVHRDTIAACVYDSGARHCCYEAEFSAHDPKKLRFFVKHVHTQYGKFRSCYEASSCEYVLYNALEELGVDCAVIAPGSIPRRSGDRIKTDRRDARKLAEYFAAGLLTECFIPDREVESARNLVRSRAGMMTNLHRAKMRAIFLLRSQGHTYTTGDYWTQKFMTWINKLELDQPNDDYVLRGYLTEIEFIETRIREVEQQIRQTAATSRFGESIQILQGFRGIGLISSMQLICEIVDFSRFERPTELMAWLGLIPSQRSSGNTIRHGSITKTGNTHMLGKHWFKPPGSIFTLPGAVHP